MKQFNIDLRSEYMQMSTSELEKLLDEELGKQTPNDDVVLTLLHILKDREPERPIHLSAREEAAVKRYQEKRHKDKYGKLLPRRVLSMAASLVLILTLFFTVAPQRAEAETFWEMLQRITQTVLEYFSPRENFDEAERKYVFQTNNPALQQIYDAAVKLGVTEAVVPMWLPEDTKLTKLQLAETPMLKGVHACFSYGQGEITYRMNLYNGESAHQFYKDDTHYESYEWDGTTYHITRNKTLWVVVWEKEKTECLLTVDCQEDTLYRILRSIYVTEVQ